MSDTDQTHPAAPEEAPAEPPRQSLLTRYHAIVETIIGACVGMGGVLTITLVRRYAARLADPDDHEVTVLRFRGLG